MMKCPACSVPLPVTQFFMCASGRCDPGADAALRATGPVRQIVPQPGAARSSTSIWTATCPQCGGVEVEVCPTPTCRHPLPPGWRETDGTVVALAGSRATGKSVYIAVLVKQLQQFGELAQMRVGFATGRSAEAFRRVFDEPLFGEQKMLEFTTRMSEESSWERDPLILEIAPARGERHFLVLRDVSGEDLNSAAPDVQRLRHFADADVVLFLLDPLALPDVRAVLAGLVPHQQQLSDDPRLALDNVIRMVTTGRRPRFGVVLSKFDVLQAVRDVRGAALARIMQNPGAAFCREPSWRGPYDQDDALLLHGEIRSLLRWLGAGDVVVAMDRLTERDGVEHRFFAVSALGDPPDGTYLHDRGIAPFRCLDPVRWALTGRSA